MSLGEQSQKWFPTHVQATVLQATDLQPKGKNGTNDAYTIIQLAQREVLHLGGGEDPQPGVEGRGFIWTARAADGEQSRGVWAVLHCHAQVPGWIG